jgi:Uma2 family endonuclease
MSDIFAVDNRHALWITASRPDGSTRIGVMTMTDTVGYRPKDWWTIDDLFELPDDQARFELVDGALLVSPAPTPHHGKAQFYLRELLQRQAPAGVAVSGDIGMRIGSNYTYFVPDLFVIPVAAFDIHPKYLLPADVRLVVEILSEHNRGRDLVLKRHYYSSVGIPRYRIVDPFEHTLTVLSLESDEATEYTAEVVPAGKTWRTDKPFPLTLDPADFC